MIKILRFLGHFGIVVLLTAITQVGGLLYLLSRYWSNKFKLIQDFLDVSIKHNYFSLENITIETPSFLQKLFGLLSESEFNKTELIDEIRNDF